MPIFTACILLAVFLLSATGRGPASAGAQQTFDAVPSLTSDAVLPPGNAGAPKEVRLFSVKFREAYDSPGVQALHARIGLSPQRHNPATGVATLQVSPEVPMDAVLQQLEQDPLVEWAEPVRSRRLTAPPPIVPNDPQYASFQKWYYDLISAPAAWGLETGKPSVTIAVVDSGVACSHPDLVNNIWRNPREIPGNGLDDDGNGFTDDVNGYDFVGAHAGDEESPDLPGDSDPCVRAGDPSAGNGLDDDGDGVPDSGVSHGTLVAGVVAAMSNNGLGVAGVCWSCTIMAVRVATPEGNVISSDVSDGIVYAAKAGAKVINLSLGGPVISQAETAAVNFAISAGAVVVAASGNDNRSPISYPARLPNVIAVGASDHRNQKGRAGFSNWGSGGANDRQVDVVAPGVLIMSTGIFSRADEALGRGTAGSPRYAAAAGTSFSAPLVSGLVGLMLSRNPGLTLAEIRTLLRNSASPLPDDPADSPDAGPGWAGAGMINAQLTLESITPGAPTPTPTRTPTASPTATGSPSPTVSPSATATSTPLPVGTRPQTITPARGSTLTGLSTRLTWNNALGATQFQVQVVPANNDGPAINLIRNRDTSYDVEAPMFGAGPYVMLPGMTYTWRVRTTTATTAIDENSPLWGPWSDDSTFKTRIPSSAGIAAVSPPDLATGVALTPSVQWSNPDPDIFYYELQLSKDPNFNTDAATATAMVYWNLVHGAIPNPPNSYAVPVSFPLEANTKYFWRVRPRVQGDGVAVPWSRLFSLTTR